MATIAKLIKYHSELRCFLLKALPRTKEHIVLCKIIDLCKDRIQSLLRWLCKPDIHKSVTAAIQGMQDDACFQHDIQENDFKQWVSNLPIVTTLEAVQDPSQLVSHVIWASQARWMYSEQIESLFCPNGQELPSWVMSIYKLGRYAVAAKVLLKLATKQPSLFFSIHVEAVQAPKQEQFSLPRTKTLMEMLARLTKGDQISTGSDLADQQSRVAISSGLQSYTYGSCRDATSELLRSSPREDPSVVVHGHE